MRSRLIVLEVLAAPSVSVPARAAWEGLSRACHRHAYELSPADAEIAALLGHVAALGDLRSERDVVAVRSNSNHVPLSTQYR